MFINYIGTFEKGGNGVQEEYLFKTWNVTYIISFIFNTMNCVEQNLFYSSLLLHSLILYVEVLKYGYFRSTK